MALPADWWLELAWTSTGTLDPILVALYADLPVEDGDVRVDLDRGQAYAWLDRTIAAEEADKEHPNTLEALLPGQQKALQVLHAHIGAVLQESTRQSAAMWRAKGQSARPETLKLLRARVTDRVQGELAYVVLQFSSALHIEHGVQALVLGDQVQRVAHELPDHSIPGTSPSTVEPRQASSLPEFLQEPSGGPAMDSLLDELLSLGLGGGKPKARTKAPKMLMNAPRRAKPRAPAAPLSGPEPQGSLPEGLLTAWEEREWIELTPDADRAKVRRELEALVEALPANKVADAVCELDGVEELYASDDDLEEFLELW